MGGAEPDQIAPQKEVVLTGLRAPMLARGRNSKQDEEPYAWHAREFLRKKCIGKVVRFEVVFRSPDSGREFVTLYLGDENLGKTMVANGWAWVQQKKKQVDDDDDEKQAPKLQGERAELVEIQAEAERNGLGVHNAHADPMLARRVMEWNPDVDLFYRYRGQPIPAVIDRVIDGSTYRVELLGLGENSLHHTMINLCLAGAEAPATPMPEGVQSDRKGDRKGPRKEKPQPFAMEAQAFVEARLLHRDVHVILQGHDRTPYFFGTVQYAKGNITERLLEEGYARYVPWSARLTSDAPKLQKLEESAKQQKLRIWFNHIEKKHAENEVKEYIGTVTQVLSGDRIAIQVDGTNQELKFSLASIRAPRMGVRGQPDEPFAFEARESLRKKLIGKQVKVEVEYARKPLPESGNIEKQVFASVYLGKENVSESLVREGLATSIPHRRNEDRAANYERILAAEYQAEKAKVGVHGPAPRQQAVTVDLTLRGGGRGANREQGEEDEKKDAVRAAQIKSLARQKYEQMQYDKNITGIVEYVFSGSRFKVRIPKYNVLVPFILAGVNTPPAKDNNVHAQQALESSRGKLMQRNVRLEVEGLDKYDNFLGNLYLNKENIAVSLLNEGLARIIPASASRNRHQKELRSAEDSARQARAGLWKDWVERPVEEPEEEYEAPPEAFMEEKQQSGPRRLRIQEGENIRVRVTEITDAANFYCHFLDDESVNFVEDRMRTFGEEETDEFSAPDHLPPKGSTCAGLFADGSWYRVRIEGSTAQGQWRAFFLDYGNRELLELSALRVLDDDLVRIPPLAHAGTLSAIKGPGEASDYYDNAGLAFSNLTWDKELKGHIDLVEGGKLHFTLFDEDDESTSINQKLLLAGWVRVAKRPPRRLVKLADQLREVEDQAKQAHRGIWEYGDVSDEEETERDERGRVPLKKAGVVVDPKAGKKAAKEREAKAAEEGGKGGKDKDAGKEADKGKKDKGGKKK